MCWCDCVGVEGCNCVGESECDVEALIDGNTVCVSVWVGVGVHV